MAIPIIKGSKKEMVGSGDIIAAINLVPKKKEQSDFPDDCIFTCDKEYFIDHPIEYTVIYKEQGEEQEYPIMKATRDYAIGAKFQSYEHPEFSWVTFYTPLLDDDIPSAFYAADMNEEQTEWYLIYVDYIEFDAFKYNNEDWAVYRSDGDSVISDLPIFQCHNSDSLEEIDQQFLSYVHAKIRK